MSSLEEAVAVVEDFLALVGTGRLREAAAYLAPGARMMFPGDVVHTDLESLRADGLRRYRFVDKHRDTYDGAEDGTHVLSTGRLFGVNLHGVAFDNVRYADHFRLTDGLISEQRVWNDLAVTGVLRVRSTHELDPRRRPGEGAKEARP